MNTVQVWLLGKASKIRMADQKTVRGYKIVDKDLRGFNGFQYEIGKMSEVKGDIKLCRNGLHFCERASDCFTYAEHLNLAKPWRYLIIETSDEPVSDGIKMAVRSLMPQKELSARQWLDIVLKETQVGEHNVRMFSELAAITANISVLVTVVFLLAFLKSQGQIAANGLTEMALRMHSPRRHPMATSD